MNQTKGSIWFTEFTEDDHKFQHLLSCFIGRRISVKLCTSPGERGDPQAEGRKGAVRRDAPRAQRGDNVLTPSNARMLWQMTNIQQGALPDTQLKLSKDPSRRGQEC